DFEVIKPISRGAFGKVYLVRKKVTQDIYAMKILKKKNLIRKNMVTHVLAEHKALTMANNPFVVKLFYAFPDKDNLYLVMEYLIGGRFIIFPIFFMTALLRISGDLSALLANFGTFDEDMTRMYSAEVVLALEYLHANGITHRDLKPDNMLVNHEGHIKLTVGAQIVLLHSQAADRFIQPTPAAAQTFTEGNASEDPSTSTTSKPPSAVAVQAHGKALLGTPDYLAPELLLGLEHGPGVDWWALGVCMFEFLVGIPPFSADSPELIFARILDHEIEWPEEEEISNVAKNVVLRLLNPRVPERLKADSIKGHEFFSVVDWDHMLDHPAPFIPAPDNGTDTSYFAREYSVLPAVFLHTQMLIY
ncbi:serine/threonine protein kinase 15, partial [Zopfochytrium polystomum]